MTNPIFFQKVGVDPCLDIVKVYIGLHWSLQSLPTLQAQTQRYTNKRHFVTPPGGKTKLAWKSDPTRREGSVLILACPPNGL